MIIQVVAFSLSDVGTTQATINPVTSYSGNIVALYLDAKDNQILVGDLMKSISVLEYSDNTQSIHEIARDFYSPAWITAVRMLGQDSYLAAENNNNILMWRRQDSAALKADIGIHLGDQINCFREGIVDYAL